MRRKTFPLKMAIPSRDANACKQRASGDGHIGLGVYDIYAICAEWEKRGGKVLRQPGPMERGPIHPAYIADPDGYRIGLIDLKTRG